MRVISVFEHETIRERLSDAEKNALDKLRGSSGKKMFNVGFHDVAATSFVGVVQVGSHTVQVLPKMHRSPAPAEECDRQATSNLLYLLSYARKLHVTEPEISKLTRKSAPLSKIL